MNDKEKKHRDQLNKTKILKRSSFEMSAQHVSSKYDEILEQKDLVKLKPKRTIETLKFDNGSKHSGRQKAHRASGLYKHLEANWTKEY